MSSSNIWEVSEVNMTKSQVDASLAKLGRNILARCKAAREQGKPKPDGFTKRVWTLAADSTSKAEGNDEPCEKCGRPTYFSVQVNDRRARWCGCE